MKLKPTTECPICHKIIDTSKSGAMGRHVHWQHRDVKVKTETKVKSLSPSLVTSDDIADALLRKVIKWATEKESYVEYAQTTRELRNKCQRLESENKSLREERDRLLKIHNEQAVRNSQISVDELKRIARS